MLLGGLSVGNYLGGKIADYIRSEKQASWLFLAASVVTLCVLLAETPPSWLVRNPIEHFINHKDGVPLAGGEGEFLHQALGMSGYSWWFRVLFWTGVVFFVPAITMGTVSPVVAKLAVERLRRSKRTGTAIGQVYAWGMVGSILGTFLTGFLLIDVFGTKGVLLLLATVLALAAFWLGEVFHAVWAGIPLGLCVVAFVPVPFLERQALTWGVREDPGDEKASGPNRAVYTDESNYYFIKVAPSLSKSGHPMRELVLDNLIHGYFIPDHPDELDYDYEHIYALVTKRLVDARKKDGKQTLDPTAPPDTPLSTLFLGAGSYTFPRFLQNFYPGATADIAEIDPAVTRANHKATFLPGPLPPGQPNPHGIHTVWGDARQFVEKRYQSTKKYDIVFGDAFNDFSVPWHLTTRQFNDMISQMLTDDGLFMINIIDIYRSDEQAKKDARIERGDLEKENDRGARTRFRRISSDEEKAIDQAHHEGGFLSSWVETARSTFPYIYVFGTNSGYAIDEESGKELFKPPGRGLRETFVVVAAKKKIDIDRLPLAELGGHYADPDYDQEIKIFTPYAQKDLDALKVRSQGIILTDDYAPVENLLAPVAATRGHED